MQFNDVQIQQVSFHKFLGVTIDSKLSWDEHVGVICNRIAKHVGIMFKLNFIPQTILLKLHNVCDCTSLNLL